MTLEIRLARPRRSGRRHLRQDPRRRLRRVSARACRPSATTPASARARRCAPTRASSDEPITNRNKVYEPDHLLVLDPDAARRPRRSPGLRPGGTLLLNTPEPLEPRSRRASRDSAGRGRRHRASPARHGIGTPLGGDRQHHDRRRLARGCRLAARRARGRLRAARLRRQPRRGARRRTRRAVREPPAARLEARVGAGVRSPGRGRDAAHRPRRGPADRASRPATGARSARATSSTSRRATPCARPATTSSASSRRCSTEARTRGAPRCSRTHAARRGVRARLPGAVHGGLQPRRATTAPSTSARSSAGSADQRGRDRARRPRPRRRRAASPSSAAARPGLGAAYELAQQGHRVTIFEGERELGGVLRTGIPTYRLPREVLDREIDAILALGVEVRCGQLHRRGTHRRSSPRQYDARHPRHRPAAAARLDGPGSELARRRAGHRASCTASTSRAARRSQATSWCSAAATPPSTARAARCAAAPNGDHRLPAQPRRDAGDPRGDRGGRARGRRSSCLQRAAGRRSAAAGASAAVELAEVEHGPARRERPAPARGQRPHRRGWPCDQVLLALGQSRRPRAAARRAGSLDGGRVHRRRRGRSPVFAAGDFATGDGTVTHAIGDGRRAAGRAAARARRRGRRCSTRPDRASAVPVTDIRFDHFARLAPAHGARTSPWRSGSQHLRRGQPRPRRRRARRSAASRAATARSCDTCLVYCPEGIIRAHRTTATRSTTLLQGLRHLRRRVPARAPWRCIDAMTDAN